MTVEIRSLEEGDVADLQRLLEACSEYSIQVTGYPTGPSDALSTLIARPPDLPEEAKTVLGLRVEAGLVAVADLLVGHPGPGLSTLGLLLVHPDHRRAGLGRRLHEHAVGLARGDTLRVGVIDTTDCAGFWRALGYVPEGDAVPYRYDHLQSTVRHWRLEPGSLTAARPAAPPEP